MAEFHIQIVEPVEIKHRLGKPDLHWKQGYSAYELSTRWIRAKGVPASVRAVLEQAPEWRSAMLLDGIFERVTKLPGDGMGSQTDLLALVDLGSENAIIGVEGKVSEPFGEPVRSWLGDAPSANKLKRLTGLCATLGVDVSTVGPLYYQLLHRTCAAIYEAKRLRYRRALMLVHSFAMPAKADEKPIWFDEFQRFSDAVGMPVTRPGEMSPSKECDGVGTWLAWVSDTPTA